MCSDSDSFEVLFMRRKEFCMTSYQQLAVIHEALAKLKIEISPHVHNLHNIISDIIIYMKGRKFIYENFYQNSVGRADSSF